MSILNFPPNPLLNQIHTSGKNSWKWNGESWVGLGTSETDSYLASNTVLVSANGGSIISAANGINFVNSDTTSVSVSIGISGNANVYVESLSGGGGGGGTVTFKIGDVITTSDISIENDATWLPCDGAIYNRSSYPQLANTIEANEYGLSNEPFSWGEGIDTGISSGGYPYLVDIEYGDGRYFLLNQLSSNVYYTSTDLQTWEEKQISYPFDNVYDILSYVKYANSTLVISNGTLSPTNNVYVTKDSGNTWLEINVPYSTNTNYNSYTGLVSNGNVFVFMDGVHSVTGNASVIFSYDGINWQEGDTKIKYPNKDAYLLKFGNNKWHYHSWNITNYMVYIHSSTDLVNWSITSSFYFGDLAYGVAYGRGKWFLLIGTPMTIYTSDDDCQTWQLSRKIVDNYNGLINEADGLWSFGDDCLVGTGELFASNYGYDTQSTLFSLNGYEYKPVALQYKNQIVEYTNGSIPKVANKIIFTDTTIGGNLILFTANTYPYDTNVSFSVPKINLKYPYKAYIKAS